MKKKKNLIISLISLCLIISCGLRIYYVNKTAKRYEVTEFDYGEVVDLGDNFFNKKMNSTKGYSVKVLNSSILSYKDIIDKYNNGEGDPDLYDSKYVLLELEYKNNNPELKNDGELVSGVDMNGYRLEGDGYCLRTTRDLAKILNPFLQDYTFALEPNKEAPTFKLAFSISIDPETLQKKAPPKLIVSKYPETLILSITDKDHL